MLDYYEQIAKAAIEAEKDKTGVQAVRLAIVRLLQQLIK
jgi:hypothetical protein